MIRGQLSEMQRDKAWEGKELDERKAMTAHNLSKSDAAEDVGIIMTGTGATMDAQGQGKSAKKKKEREQLHQQMMLTAGELSGMLDQRANDLQDERGQNSARIGELEDRNEARADILALIAAGGLDLENLTPAQAALLDRAGIEIDEDTTVEEVERAARDGIDADQAEIDRLERRNEEIDRELEAIEEARRLLEADPENPQAALDYLESENVSLEANGNVNDAESRIEVHARELNDESADNHSRLNELDGGVAIDEEVSEFMQILSGYQGMFTNEQIAEEMHNEIADLSDEARDLFSNLDETREMFEIFNRGQASPDAGIDTPENRQGPDTPPSPPISP